MAQENRPRATNAEPAKDYQRAGIRSVPIVSQSRRTARFDSRRVRAHRAIVRELDEFLGIFRYPEPAILYAVAPSREAVPDE